MRIFFYAFQKLQVVCLTMATLTTDELYGNLVSTTAAPPGFNVEGGSVFTNFVDAYNERQFFFLQTGSVVYEKPESEPVHYTLFGWCSDLTFSDFSNSSLKGYTGRCAERFIAGYAEAISSGAQVVVPYSQGEYVATAGISAVFTEHLNLFEGQVHRHTDDYVFRFWDSGRKTAPVIGWEGHDEGDASSNAATSSFSSFAEITWMSAEEVVQLFNTSTDDFTLENFRQVYKETWIKDHEVEAATNNPFPDAELEIVEQVKNETNTADETTTPIQPSTAEDAGSDGASNPVGDDSGSGRKLTSVTARFVSAALRVFGI